MAASIDTVDAIMDEALADSDTSPLHLTGRENGGYPGGGGAASIQ